MSTDVFVYKARDTSGARQTGKIAGRNITEATAALKAKGLFPITLEPEASALEAARPISQRIKRTGPMTARQTAEFLSRLAKLVARRITLDRALAIMGESGENRISGTAASIRGALREGVPLSQALRDKAGVTDTVTLALVRGAEVSGDMDKALVTAADILQSRLAVRRRIVTGLLYPGILLVVAIASLALIMIAIIPQFVPLIEDRYDLIPPLGKAVFAVSQIMTTLWPTILAALIGTLFLAWFMARRGTLLKFSARIGSAVPFVRRLVLRNQMMLLLHVLGALLGRDVTLSSALRVVTSSVADARIKASLSDATRRVESGAALSAALKAQALLPYDAIEMIRIGEETGDLRGMVSKTSVDMREAADRDLERFLLLFQPALIVGVGLLIGVSLYALFSAIVAVNTISF
ncbi:type II secretion system F family protein [Litoreibacter roseus]|uniref:Type II secretion system protein GspF n=1 Tax=Litoreibacter roseus TaxID=2601869 RepID=A0A6N6JKV2_9RHOB|nr:type II secretion system F family protein [Litoreibacter roseus]GFE66490.1 type II secretion system protein GspF [Litoreibacter roseus]